MRELSGSGVSRRVRFLASGVAAMVVLLISLGVLPRSTEARASADQKAGVAKRGTAVLIEYPENDSIFPPGMTAPTFLWRDDSGADAWRISIEFADGAAALETTVPGEHMKLGPMDERCVAPTNRPPELTPKLAAAWSWKPDAGAWKTIQQHSVKAAATIHITGLKGGTEASLPGRIRLTTSSDAINAPIFYRDVPLMPTQNTDGVVQPLPTSAVHLINWRLRDIREPESHTVLTDNPTCLNCHSFSRDGKTLGIDLDGPNNDKGLYAISAIEKHVSIDDNKVVQWNTDGRAGKIRVGFMSQISPNGRYVVSTFSGSNLGFSQTFYVRNFPDYRFLQVFYPTKGILEYYDRTTGRREPLPGADDPNYVQTGGFWSPDGKWIVFARAAARDPYVKDKPLAAFANDPNETKIQYDLYRIPFNEGKGGTPERIVGASQNGMSNSFPKISPDGKWIVFVQAKNGEVMRPDSQLYIVPFNGGTARPLRSNLAPMNSWHSWSPNGRWLVFSSKARGPYTQMYLTHIDEQGNSSPAILVENATASNRAVNLPEFLNAEKDALEDIQIPAIAVYRLIEKALDSEDAKDYSKAVTILEEAVKTAPDDARLHNDLSAALYMRGENDRAAEEARKALEMSPTMTQAHFNLGASLMQERKFEEAIREFDKTLDLNPGFPPAEEAIGQSYDALRKDDAALPHWERAIRFDPQSVSALLGAARILAGSPHANLRNGREALRLALRADDLTKDADATVLDTLGAAYAETGDYAKALAVAQRAMELATAQGDGRLQQMIAGRMQLYKANRPYRD
ncbi:tetratricopeptide repeat protein [Acidobacteria bacterium AB60]|nr:tetratricopeptide repeat protein [Acidobacteria bacterium AB60]